MARTKVSTIAQPTHETFEDIIQLLEIPPASTDSMRRWLPSMLWRMTHEWLNECDERDGKTPPEIPSLPVERISGSAKKGKSPPPISLSLSISQKPARPPPGPQAPSWPPRVSYMDFEKSASAVQRESLQRREKWARSQSRPVVTEQGESNRAVPDQTTPTVGSTATDTEADTLSELHEVEEEIARQIDPPRDGSLPTAFDTEGRLRPQRGVTKSSKDPVLPSRGVSRSRSSPRKHPLAFEIFAHPDLVDTSGHGTKRRNDENGDASEVPGLPLSMSNSSDRLAQSTATKSSQRADLVIENPPRPKPRLSEIRRRSSRLSDPCFESASKRRKVESVESSDIRRPYQTRGSPVGSTRTSDNDTSMAPFDLRRLSEPGPRGPPRP